MAKLKRSKGICERCEKERLLARYMRQRAPDHFEIREFCRDCISAVKGLGWKAVKTDQPVGVYAVTQVGDAKTPFVVTRQKTKVPKAGPERPVVINTKLSEWWLTNLTFDVVLRLVREGRIACRPFHQRQGLLLLKDTWGLRLVKHLHGDQYAETGGHLLMSDLIAEDWLVYK